MSSVHDGEELGVTGKQKGKTGLKKKSKREKGKLKNNNHNEKELRLR